MPEAIPDYRTWNKKRPEKLDHIYGKRRTSPAQITSRSRSFLKYWPHYVGPSFQRGRWADARAPARIVGRGIATASGSFAQKRLSGSWSLPYSRTDQHLPPCAAYPHHPGGRQTQFIDLQAHEMNDGQSLASAFPTIPRFGGRGGSFIADARCGAGGRVSF